MSKLFSINKNKEIFLIFILLIFNISTGFSQRFSAGFSAGVSSSQIDGDAQKGYKKVGVFAGVFTDILLNEKSSVRIEIEYLSKGAVNNVEQAGGTVYEEFKTHLQYLEIPVLFKYSFWSKISAGAGISTGYLLKSEIYTKGSLVSEQYYDMKTVDISPIVVADFHFFKKLSLTLKFRYSIAPIREDVERWYNNNLCLGLRYRFQ